MDQSALSARVSPRWEKLAFVALPALAWFACFFSPLTAKGYTGWDTHDLGFVNFLYFSDALREGSIPLWNHLIQSGTFFPTFNNIGLFTPFQLLFVFLSWAIDPLYAFELMIQAAVLIGGAGTYLLLRARTTDRFIAMFGATSFVVVVLVPIVGQFGFVVSLSALPWLLFAADRILATRSPAPVPYIAAATFGALYLASGYLWMNLVNLLIVLIYCVVTLAAQENPLQRFFTSAKPLLLFFFTLAAIYAALMLPGYVSMRFNYAAFLGDYASPEPRLRSLVATYRYLFPDSLNALVAAIDTGLVTRSKWTTGWSWGAGWPLWAAFLVMSAKRASAQRLFWYALLVVAFLYSAGSIGTVVKHVPVLNANRWWVIGHFYLAFALLMLALGNLNDSKEKETTHPSPAHLLLVVAFVSSLLLYVNAPPLQYALALSSIIVITLLTHARKEAVWPLGLAALIAINLVSQHFGAEHAPYRPMDAYASQLASRNLDMVIRDNHRQIHAERDYIYDDRSWIVKKAPDAHGYNNLGNPFYWYVKNDPVIGSIAFIAPVVRKEADVRRADYPRDNAFAEALMGDVSSDMRRPTIDPDHFHDLQANGATGSSVDSVEIAPNTARFRVHTTGPAYLVFNNVDYPGWTASIDGKPAELARANRIFEGVYLPAAGDHEVEFRFRPLLTIGLLLLPYALLLACLLILLPRLRAAKFPW